MKNRIPALLVALLAFQIFPVSAEDAKVEKSKPAETLKAEKAKDGKGADRVPNEEWNKLSDEQKAAKLKERREKSEARIKTLKEKKTAGTLTPAEEKQLERLESRSKRGPAKPKRSEKPDKKSDESK
jgi:hypothetical protein